MTVDCWRLSCRSVLGACWLLDAVWWLEVEVGYGVCYGCLFTILHHPSPSFITLIILHQSSSSSIDLHHSSAFSILLHHSPYLHHVLGWIFGRVWAAGASRESCNSGREEQITASYSDHSLTAGTKNTIFIHLLESCNSGRRTQITASYSALNSGREDHKSLLHPNHTTAGGVAGKIPHQSSPILISSAIPFQPLSNSSPILINDTLLLRPPSRSEMIRLLSCVWSRKRSE